MMTKNSVVIFGLSLLLATGLHGHAAAQEEKTIPARKYGLNAAAKKAEEETRKKADKNEEELSPKERKRKQREEKKKLKEERRQKEYTAQLAAERAKDDAARKERKRLASEEKAAPAAPTRKKQEIFYAPTILKNSYRIHVLLPLYLDEMVKGNSVAFNDHVPDKAVQGLQFYQGLKLAADSLKRTGYHLDIYINDVGSIAESADLLISDRKLDSADLLIGAVQQHDIPALAGYAKKRHINFVSALSPNDGYVKGNQYFTMLQPTLKSHCEYIIDDMSKKYPGRQVALLYRTAAPNEENAGQYMLTDNYSDVLFKKLLCNTLPDKKSLLTVLDTSRPNIVVIPVLDIQYADSLLRQLARLFPNTHFEVYGMPTWNAIANLRKAGSYNNLTVNVTYPFSFEAAGNMAEAVERSYKIEFGGKATEMVYRGYEALFWYAGLLTRYGTIFNNDYKDNSAAPFTRFEVKPRWDGNGSLLYNENRHIYRSTYQGGVYKTE